MKYLLYTIGCILFSIGATLFIISGLGTDPLDVFSIGVKQTIGLMIGTTQSLFAITCLIIWSGLHKWKIPPVSTFLTFFFCGYMIDFFLWCTNHTHLFNRYAEMFAGVVLCTQASAMIIMSSFGIRAMDLVAITLYERTKTPFWLFKGIAEVLLLLTGWYLGGPVGVGTIAFLTCVGWLIQPCIRLNSKFLPNFSVIR